jgi:SAM-dependent methyltransferase
MAQSSQSAKQQVHDFWNSASCGEELFLLTENSSGYAHEMQTRYELEPCILDFANFEGARGQKVLEIGVGLGADHQRFAQGGAQLWGIDLTPRAIEHTRRRLTYFGLQSTLAVGDAEALNFSDDFFDQVYAWGVLHHSPDTPKAIREVHRVLKPGGRASIMIYNKWSIVGLMLWVRYALLGLRPWLTLAQIYDCYLESPGTKAYTLREVRELFAAFSHVDVSTVLTHGDLLESGAGQRHEGRLLRLARKLWPRTLIRRLLPGAGLFLVVQATK